MQEFAQQWTYKQDVESMLMNGMCGWYMPAWALSMSQSAVTGMTPLAAHPANLGPAAALISRWLFFLLKEVL